MNFIQIIDWEKHQHYKDRRPPWIKLELDIIEEFNRKGNPKKFYNLPDSAKLTYLCLLCLRAHYDDHIPFPSEKWLKTKLGINKIDLQPLEKAGYISFASNSGAEVGQVATVLPPQRQRQRQRGETETDTESKQKYRDYVLLAKKEYDRLCLDFGEKIVESKIEDLDLYIGTNPASRVTKYADHNRTIRAWLKKDGIQPKQDSPVNITCPKCGQRFGKQDLKDGKCPVCEEVINK